LTDTLSILYSNTLPWSLSYNHRVAEILYLRRANMMCLTIRLGVPAPSLGAHDQYAFQHDLAPSGHAADYQDEGGVSYFQMRSPIGAHVCAWLCYWWMRYRVRKWCVGQGCELVRSLRYWRVLQLSSHVLLHTILSHSMRVLSTRAIGPSQSALR